MTWLSSFLIGFSLLLIFNSTDDVGFVASLLVLTLSIFLFVMSAEQNKRQVEENVKDTTESVWPKHKDTVSIEAKRIGEDKK